MPLTYAPSRGRFHASYHIKMTDTKAPPMPLGKLIKKVRKCKTAAEERKLISNESALIRSRFSDAGFKTKHRELLKLFYFEMMGYPTQFG